MIISAVFAIQVFSKFYLCVCVCHMFEGIQGGQKRVRDPLKLVTGHYEPPDVDAGNRIKLLCRSNKHS